MKFQSWQNHTRVLPRRIGVDIFSGGAKHRGEENLTDYPGPQNTQPSKATLARLKATVLSALENNVQARPREPK